MRRCDGPCPVENPGGQAKRLANIGSELVDLERRLLRVVQHAPPPPLEPARVFRCHCCGEDAAAFGMRDTLMAHLEGKHMRCILRCTAALVLLVWLCSACLFCLCVFVCCVCLVGVLPEAASAGATPVSDALCDKAELLRWNLLEQRFAGSEEARDGAARRAREELAGVLDAGRYKPPSSAEEAASELQKIASSFGWKAPPARGRGRAKRTGSATNPPGGRPPLAVSRSRESPLLSSLACFLGFVALACFQFFFSF